MTEQSDDALVEELARAIYDATHAGLSNCYAWDDVWEDYQEARRETYYREARAILPILHSREAAAKADAEACAPYLKDGETPAECIKRNLDDSIALMELLAAERIKVSNYEKTMQVISESGLEEAKALVAAKEQAERLAEALLVDRDRQRRDFTL